MPKLKLGYVKFARQIWRDLAKQFNRAGKQGAEALGQVRMFPRNFRACSSAGRALALQARGQEFDPPQVHIELEDYRISRPHKIDAEKTRDKKIIRFGNRF